NPDGLGVVTATMSGTPSPLRSAIFVAPESRPEFGSAYLAAENDSDCADTTAARQHTARMAAMTILRPYNVDRALMTGSDLIDGLVVRRAVYRTRGRHSI